MVIEKERCSMKFKLLTNNLVLRQFSANDSEKIFHMSQEESLRKWIPNQVYKDLEETREAVHFLCQQYLKVPAPQITPYVLGIDLKLTGELIGHVGLSPMDSFVEIGYAIEEKYQGKGYATEAIYAITDWAINKLKIEIILGIVDSENKGSCRVLEKCGYVFVEEKVRNSFGQNRLCKIFRMNRICIL
jgi:ribosomal-protein-alanine N-acetyltransferase